VGVANEKEPPVQRTLNGSNVKTLSAKKGFDNPMLAQPDYVFKNGDSFVAAKVELGTLVLANTRNEEAANEGYFGNLITVIPLQEAIAIAKVVLAAQEQADEDTAFDAWMDRQYQYYLDYKCLVDDALMHEVAF
jgi:hypothetical protein